MYRYHFNNWEYHDDKGKPSKRMGRKARSLKRGNMSGLSDRHRFYQAVFLFFVNRGEMIKNLNSKEVLFLQFNGNAVGRKKRRGRYNPKSFSDNR